MVAEPTNRPEPRYGSATIPKLLAWVHVGAGAADRSHRARERSGHLASTRWLLVEFERGSGTAQPDRLQHLGAILGSRSHGGCVVLGSVVVEFHPRGVRFAGTDGGEDGAVALYLHRVGSRVELDRAGLHRVAQNDIVRFGIGGGKAGQRQDGGAQQRLRGHNIAPFGMGANCVVEPKRPLPGSFPAIRVSFGSSS